MITLASCAAAPAPQDEGAPRIRGIDQTRHESPGCDDGGPCARVTHRYPRFDTESALGAALHAWTLERLGRLPDSVAGGRAPGSPDAAAEAFLERFDAFRERVPEARGDWYDEHRVEVLHASGRVISLAHHRSWYTGGAHPNATRELAGFDRRNGEILVLDETLRDGVTARLRALLTRALRRERGLARDQSLADAGYFVSGARLPVTDNFAVVDGGWLFRYDAYAIAPYALGPTELTLSFDEIENLVRPDSPARPPQPPRIMERD